MGRFTSAQRIYIAIGAIALVAAFAGIAMLTRGDGGSLTADQPKAEVPATPQPSSAAPAPPGSSPAPAVDTKK